MSVEFVWWSVQIVAITRWNTPEMVHTLTYRIDTVVSRGSMISSDTQRLTMYVRSVVIIVTIVMHTYWITREGNLHPYICPMITEGDTHIVAIVPVTIFNSEIVSE
tara:strand:+ start:129 stop:446 length:318 start_codon:yes stop_codon:yes gene_type:complete